MNTPPHDHPTHFDMSDYTFENTGNTGTADTTISNITCSTREPASESPATASAACDEHLWEEFFSRTYHTPYWFNLATGESTWTKPASVIGKTTANVASSGAGTVLSQSNPESATSTMDHDTISYSTLSILRICNDPSNFRDLSPSELSSSYSRRAQDFEQLVAMSPHARMICCLTVFNFLESEDTLYTNLRSFFLSLTSRLWGPKAEMLAPLNELIHPRFTLPLVAAALRAHLHGAPKTGSIPRIEIYRMIINRGGHSYGPLTLLSTAIKKAMPCLLEMHSKMTDVEKLTVIEDIKMVMSIEPFSADTRECVSSFSSELLMAVEVPFSPTLKQAFKGLLEHLQVVRISPEKILQSRRPWTQAVCDRVFDCFFRFIKMPSSMLPKFVPPQSSLQHWPSLSAVSDADVGVFRRPYEAGMVLILLGPPGVGKSYLGNGLMFKGLAHSFADIGARLKHRGALHRTQKLSTVTRLREQWATAKELLQEALHDYLASDLSKPLVVTFVKTGHDILELLSIVRQSAGNDIRIQFIHVVNSTLEDFVVRRNVMATSSLVQMSPHDDPEVYRRRMKKWMRNKDDILKLARATNNLYQLDIDRLKQSAWASQITIDLQELTLCEPEEGPLMVLDLSVRESILDRLHRILEVASPMQPSLPASVVRDCRQLSWLAAPERYEITYQAEFSSRSLLCALGNGQYWLLDYVTGDLFDLANQQETEQADQPFLQALPPGTVLDGEFVNIQGGYCERITAFLVDDVLAIHGDKVWHLPRADRKHILDGILSEDLSKKLSTQLSGVVQVRRKPGCKVSSESVALLLQGSVCPDSDDDFVIPVKGLVFNHMMPYQWTNDQLRFYWFWSGDVVSGGSSNARDENKGMGEVDSSSSSTAMPIAEIQPTVESAITMTSYSTTASSRMVSNANPQLTIVGAKSRRHRNDIDTSINDGSSDSDNDGDYGLSLKRFRRTQPFIAHQQASLMKNVAMIEVLAGCVPVRDLVCELRRLESFRPMQIPMGLSPELMPATQQLKVMVHPAKAVPFIDLYAEIMSCVARGAVERYEHPETGLEVFNVKSKERCESDIENICRGLVLHAPSQQVVATAFVRFYPPSPGEFMERRDRVVRASMKLDGSLVIVFLWQGQVVVTTRRRMDSEQALRARSMILQSPALLRELREGWTYLFELIGERNAHAVDYPFSQALVLITVINSNGIECSYEERAHFAQRTQSMVVPALSGTLEDIIAMMYNYVSASTYSTTGSGAGCKVCGCSTEVDAFADRVCYCDTCHQTGCTLPNEGLHEEQPSLQKQKQWLMRASHALAATSDTVVLSSPLAASCEGWVVEDDTDGSRFKLLNPNWQHALGELVNVMHPAYMWNCIRMDQQKHFIDNPDFPRHAKAELIRLIEIYGQCFDEMAWTMYATVIKKSAEKGDGDEECEDDMSTCSDGSELANDPNGDDDDMDGSNGGGRAGAGAGAGAAAVVLSPDLITASEAFKVVMKNRCSEEDIYMLLNHAITQDDCCLLTSIFAIADRSGVVITWERLLERLDPQVLDLAHQVRPMSASSPSRRSSRCGLKLVSSAAATAGSLQANPLSMVTSLWNPNAHGSLRLLFLHLVRPTTEDLGGGALYTPSEWLSQTYAKGWTTRRIPRGVLTWHALEGGSQLVGMMNKFQPVADCILSFLSPPTREQADARGLEPSDPSFFEIYKMAAVCRSWRHCIFAMLYDDLGRWKEVVRDFKLSRRRRGWWMRNGSHASETFYDDPNGMEFYDRGSDVEFGGYGS